MCVTVCVCVCVCVSVNHRLMQTCRQTTFQTISGAGALPCSQCWVLTQRLSHSWGLLVGTETECTGCTFGNNPEHDLTSTSLFSSLCHSVLPPPPVLHNHSSLNMWWCHPDLILHSLFSHPSSPSLCHPFYCKPCDWQLQLQVLPQASASAVWLCKDPTLPPASTPVRLAGLPLATGFKSGQKKTPRSFGEATTA